MSDRQRTPPSGRDAALQFHDLGPPDAPPPGGAAGEAQTLLLAWDRAWRAAAARRRPQAGPPPVGPLLRRRFAAPLLIAALGAAAHAAAALAAPMLLRTVLTRMDEAKGPDWQPVRAAGVQQRFGAQPRLVRADGGHSGGCGAGRRAVHAMQPPGLNKRWASDEARH
jgi:hypothetical protein